MSFKKIISALPLRAALIFASDATMAAAQVEYQGEISIAKQFKIYSKILKQNYNFSVQLPANYAQNKTCYPLILLLDAKRYLSATSNAIQALRADLYPHIPEFVLIGIDSELRMRDFTAQNFVPEFAKNNSELLNLYQQSGGAANFIKFITVELKPYINNNYRICAPSIMIGHSLAGLLSIDALQQAVVDAAISIDPSLWFDYPQTFNKLLSANSNYKNLIFAYANNQFSPGVGNSPASTNINREFVKRGKFAKTIYLPTANHYNIFYKVIDQALAALFMDYYMDIGSASFSADKMQAQYARLNQKFGANLQIEQAALNKIIKKYQRSANLQININEIKKIITKDDISK